MKRPLLLCTAVLFTLVFAAISADPSVQTPASGDADPSAPRPIAEEAAVLDRGRISARRNALARLATHPDAEAERILLAQFDRFRSGDLPPSLWLDLFEAAARRGTPALKARLAEREDELAKSRDPLTRFRECLEGGDGHAGRLVFTKKAEAGCIRCHTISGEGGNIGPDLTWLRNAMDRSQILESIVMPSAVIAPGFASATLTLKNGETISGVINSDGDDEVVLTSPVDGKTTTVKTADIKERTPIPSPMPPHFGAILDKRTIRDIVEYIAAGD